METKYPDIEVQLTGTDGNAGAIMNKVATALRRNGASSSEISDFYSEAMSGDYNNIIQTAMRWVNVS